MERLDLPWLLTADPINISYATGVRNMNVFSMMGAVRFLLVGVNDTLVMWEFAGSEHLGQASPVVDDVRTAPGVTALSGPGYRRAIQDFAAEVAVLTGAGSGGRAVLGIERVDFEVTDALRSADCLLKNATEVFVQSRLIKLPGEIDLMAEAMQRVETAVLVMLEGLQAGVTEIDVWSRFHQHLIANDGEYVSTRLVQSGERTFPYFQEAGPNVINDGDLFCIDTDSIGFGGYAVDFSRTYHVGPSDPTDRQRRLHALAFQQLQHNASLLAAGVSFEDLARQAWEVPAQHATYGYSSLVHGLGMCGEYPYVPALTPGVPFDLDGQFEPNMVICVESYIGDLDSGQGVKLEDQYLITHDGAEAMSTLPFDYRLTD